MNASLRVPDDHYRYLFESSPASFLILLPDADFTIVAATDDYLRDTLTVREEIVGKPLFEVFPDNPDAPQAHSTTLLAASFQRVIATRSVDTMALLRYDLPKPDGSGFEERYWRPVNKAAFSPDGELLYIIHRAQDVTDFVQLLSENKAREKERDELITQKMIMEKEVQYRSMELETKNAELKYTNEVLKQYARQAREEALKKDEFLAMLAHELRNPLAGIANALQLIDMVAGDPAKSAASRDVCRRQLANLTRMVDDLLDVSRVNRGAVDLRKTPLDLRDVIHSTLQSMQALIEARGLTLGLRIAPGSYRMEGDETRLEQVLSNLLGNSAKYSNAGSAIDIELNHEHIGDTRWAVLQVRDRGRGIPKEKLSAIFDLFVQVDTTIDRSRGGLGIGLTLVKRLVELHDGAVKAESAGLGHGSTFTVRLPLDASASLPEPQAYARASPAIDSASIHVLLIEDNADSRDSLQSLLEAYGYIVEAAATGESGLQRLLDSRPDTAIIDIGLPGIDGFEVARRVRASPIGDSVRLIALSGYSGTEIEEKALRAGFDAHLIKPADLASLAAIIGPRKRSGTNS